MGFLDYLPESLKQRLLDGVLEHLAETADTISTDSGGYFRFLKSDAEFRQAFAEALNRAMSAFRQDFEKNDPQLANALLHDNGWLSADAVQTLETIVSRPTAHNAGLADALVEHIVTYFDSRYDAERVRVATSYLIAALAREVLHIPQLQMTYGIQASIMTASNTAHIAQAVERMQLDLADLTNTRTGGYLASGSTDSSVLIPRQSLPESEITNMIGDTVITPERGRRLLRSRREYVLTCLELLRSTHTYRATVVGPLMLHPLWYSELRAERRQLPDYERSVLEFVNRAPQRHDGDIRIIFRNTARYIAKVDELVGPSDRSRFKGDVLDNIDLVWGASRRGPDVCCEDTGFMRVELIFDTAVVESYRPRADAPLAGGLLIVDQDAIVAARARFDEVFDGSARGQVAELDRLRAFVRGLWT